jgi:SAM-dependent methyltransferase
MVSTAAHPRGGATLAEVNHRFYESLWAQSRPQSPERFNTWPVIRPLLAARQLRLEVAPGLNPRFPLAGTRFVDLSETAVAKLVERGADATAGLVETLPYPNQVFDLIGAFDVVEHTENDDAALSELRRVAAQGATLLLSVPLHGSRWTGFDDLVGHGRRYRPDELHTKLARCGWSIEQSAVYGMQPRSTCLAALAVWAFEHRRRRAIWWYSRVILPLGLMFQKKLELRPGLLDAKSVDEVLLVCRRKD